MPKNDQIRNIKASKVTTKKGSPSKYEGSDGELTIRVLPDGLYLFVKYGNFWYHVSRLQVYNPKKKNRHGIKPISTFPGTVQGSGGGAGDIGLKPGSKLILDSSSTRTGITGDNYIQSGTTQTSSDLGNTFARDFMNITVGDRVLLTLDENSSGSRIIAGTDSQKSIIEGYKLVLSDSYGSTAGDTHITASGDDELTISVGGVSMLHFIEDTLNTMESEEIAEYLIRSGTTEDPILHLKNTTNDATGPTLKLNNAKAGGGNVGANSDTLGTISFDGEDAGGNAQQYAYITTLIDEATHGQESGSFDVYVASHDGDMNRGLRLTGGSVDTEVDVVLGTGISSLTTIAGDLGLSGTKMITAGNFELDSAGHIVLDVAATKEISLTENSGTYTPTAADHATPKHYVDAMVYPGQILGYTYNHPSSLIYHLLTTSMTVEANTHFVTFDTPPSEKVEITVSAFFDRSSTSDVGVYMGLSLNATYSQLGDEWAYDFSSGIGNSDDEADDRYENVKFVLQAAELEAVGVSNTVYIGLASTDSSAVYLRYGHALGRTYPPMIIKAVALPATIQAE